MFGFAGKAISQTLPRKMSLIARHADRYQNNRSAEKCCFALLAYILSLLCARSAAPPLGAQSVIYVRKQMNEDFRRRSLLGRLP